MKKWTFLIARVMQVMNFPPASVERESLVVSADLTPGFETGTQPVDPVHGPWIFRPMLAISPQRARPHWQIVFLGVSF
jgi:hypothetical protein